ncbi:jg8290 [Pararge aegeria aegeria]|uniref:Jg8290 protein n=1 Tax=Pararge aegeria aegeria TaxID=348720 RepID=A0A8S4R8H4_9NEOP|nr:jg8290 [Pararge aegeria aegeria]
MTQKEVAERLREDDVESQTICRRRIGRRCHAHERRLPRDEDLWAMDAGNPSPVGDMSSGWKAHLVFPPVDSTTFFDIFLKRARASRPNGPKVSTPKGKKN